ncbi:MAG: polysaccharide biosynthesis/export family protein [Bacteroidales bacterium]|nr:polysaccharide biosynthesis/export family protein [Bacteroidales bacterium]
MQEDTIKREFINEKKVDYRVQPYDNLYIRIISLDEETYSFFNNTQGSNQNMYTSDAAIYLSSYDVNDSGFVHLPFIGNVLVKNLTVEEIKETLLKIVNEYLKETTVIVKLVNFNITFIGEVYSPGEYKIYQDKINIFEAISIAGDLTTYANRNEVLIVRQTKKGSDIHQVDLLSDKILESEFYYLMPNDIVYIKPLKGKQFSFETFPYTLFLSTITTFILILTFIKM